jgi:hypothetical protein
LSEAQYFIHLAHRLNYLGDEEAGKLIGQTKQALACLQGLIRAVQKEAGQLGKTIGVSTSMLVLCLARLISCPAVP